MRTKGKINLVTKYNPHGESKIDLSSLSNTNVVWVKTHQGDSRFMDGRFICMDEPRFWTYTAKEVYKATREQAANYLKINHFVKLLPDVDRVVSYTINDERRKNFLASWGPEADWYDICPGVKGMARDAASHYHSNHPDAGSLIVVKLDVNGSALGTFRVTVELNPEFTVKEA
jgi:hypothetical protein